MNTKRILTCAIAFVLILVLSIAGILLISAETEYVYEYEVTVSNWTELNNAVQNATGSTIIELTDDVFSNTTLSIPAGTRIKLTGDFSLTTEGNHAVVTVSGHFTLDGPTITRTGVNDSSLTRGVHVLENGNFVMLDGTITGHSRVSPTATGQFRGAGVFVYIDATFTMYGGTISGNTVNCHPSADAGWASTGGGVAVFRGEFTMRGGEISGNTAGRGGGVAIDGSVFNMYDGTISDNIAVRASGGGIIGSGATVVPPGGGLAVTVYSVFVMRGGEISGNTAQGSGGGAHIEIGSRITMHGGLITQNTAQLDGGGVSLLGALARPFHMYGGTISYNTAHRDSGGIRLNGTHFQMHDGSYVINNHAYRDVGGVRVNSNQANFIMHGGEISGNTAAGNYGGVLFEGITFTMHDGLISENIAGERAGGIGLRSGSPASFFHMNGGTISDNEAGTHGGGLFVGTLSTFNMRGGEISGNTAELNGGGIFMSEQGINLSDPVWHIVLMDGIITDNHAAQHGGGLFLNFSIAAYVSDTIFSENTAERGGAIYSSWWNNILDIESGQFIGNIAEIDGGGIYLYNLGDDVWRPWYALNVYINESVLFRNNLARAGAWDFGLTEGLNVFPLMSWDGNNSIVGTHVVNNYDINNRVGTQLTLNPVTVREYVNGTYVITRDWGSHYVNAIISNTLPNRSGYMFVGWTVQAGGVTLTIDDADELEVRFTMPDTTVVLVANWITESSPQTGITGFAIGAIALITIGGVMFTFVKKADKATV